MFPSELYFYVHVLDVESLCYTPWQKGFEHAIDIKKEMNSDEDN